MSGRTCAEHSKYLLGILEQRVVLTCVEEVPPLGQWHQEPAEAELQTQRVVLFFVQQLVHSTAPSLLPVQRLCLKQDLCMFSIQNS
jgi:hypothetical protein